MCLGTRWQEYSMKVARTCAHVTRNSLTTLRPTRSAHEGHTCHAQRAIVGVARRKPAWWHSWPLTGQPYLHTLSPASPPHTLTCSTLTRPHPSHPQPCIWWAPQPSAPISLLATTRRLDLTLVFVVLPVLRSVNGPREQIRRCAWTPTSSQGQLYRAYGPLEFRPPS